MTVQVDREGIFRAVPTAWRVKKAENSSAIAIAIEFRILEQLDQAKHEWVDWTSAGDFRTFGDFYVLDRNGRPKETTIEQLSKHLGWRGSFVQVDRETPPDGIVVQVTVKAEEYRGKTKFRADWINAGDYDPRPQRLDASEVKSLDDQYGSLLRAAVNTTTRPAGRPAAPSAARPPASSNSTGPARVAAPAELVHGPAEPLTPADEAYLANVEAHRGAGEPVLDEGSGDAFASDVPWGEPDGATH